MNRELDAAKLGRRFLTDLVQTIRTPQANLETTVIMLASVFLAASIIALIVWLIVSTTSQKKRGAFYDLVVEKRFGADKQNWWTGPLLFLGMALVTTVLIYGAGSTSPSCVRCHSGIFEKNTLKSVHKSVACVACHRVPGAGGYVAGMFDYLRWLTKPIDKKALYDVRVANGSCLRCHGKVERGTLERWSIRVRHSDFLEKGARCVECHNGLAHGSSTKDPQEPSMDKCVSCHDTKQVSAKCDLCHTSKASPVTRKMPEEIIRTDVRPMRNCRACHPQTASSVCIRCHGLELPHPVGWYRGPGQKNDHARSGFLNKELCKRCHKFESAGLEPAVHTTEGSPYRKEIECNKCHAFPAVHGSEASWMAEHGALALRTKNSDNPICPECHTANNEQRCSGCHSEKLCLNCHKTDVRPEKFRHNL